MNSAHPSLGKTRQFDKVKASGLQLTRSPGKNVTYFGSLLRTLGVFFMLCVRERRVWLRIRPGHALLAMSSDKRMTDFEKEFARHTQAPDALVKSSETPYWNSPVSELALNQPVPLFMDMLNNPFDKLRTNGKLLIPFVVSPSTALRTGLSNVLLSEVEGHEQNQLVQCSLKRLPWFNWLFAVGQYQGTL